jgi:hypothetical protein
VETEVEAGWEACFREAVPHRQDLGARLGQQETPRAVPCTSRLEFSRLRMLRFSRAIPPRAGKEVVEEVVAMRLIPRSVEQVWPAGPVDRLTVAALLLRMGT